MPSDSSLESTDFSLVSGYHLDIASGLDIELVFASFSVGTIPATHN